MTTHPKPTAATTPKQTSGATDDGSPRMAYVFAADYERLQREHAAMYEALQFARYEMERLKSAINNTRDCPIALGNTGVTLGRLDAILAAIEGQS